MKALRKVLLVTGAVLVSALTAFADDRFVIDFETTDYAAVSAYDWWEASPFRVQPGQTAARINPADYVRVVDNPYAEADAQTGVAANDSRKVLAFQRSRQASNMFGARIDLTAEQRFILNNTTQYVHVLMHKPVSSRAMLIGLGRHNSSTANYSEMWASQPNDVVQFTMLGSNKPAEGMWSDVVFPIKGAGNIDIYSLVVVVDCEDPHELSDDFVAYIDKVTLNDRSTPSITLAGNYAISFDPEQVSRNDRYLNSVSIVSGGNTYVKTVEGRKSYTKAFDDFIYATPGSTVQVTGNYQGGYMHSFVYFDKDNNGRFDVPADLVASNTASDNGYKATNTFTIPSDLVPGVYRLRFKVDWSDTEPAGSMVDGNDIIKNGGCILDALFYISPAEGTVSVSNDQRNGEIVQADGTSFSNYTHPVGTPLTVKARPESGFSYAGMTLTYGEIGREEEVNDNPQYFTKYISYKKFKEDDTYTIPARYLKSDLLITGDMVETANFHPATATFPYVSPEPENGSWSAGTKAYHIKNYSSSKYVTTTAVDDSQNLKLTDAAVPTTDDGLWVVCGDDEDGYRFYNVSAGTAKVLGMTGSEGSARMKLYSLDAEGEDITVSGVTTRFFPSANGNKGYVLRMAAGSNNCWNYREPYLALWNNASSPTDNGSTFVFSDPTELEEAPVDPATLTYRKGTQITAQTSLQNGDLILLPYYYKGGSGILKYTGSQSGNLLNRQNYGPDKTATEPYAAQYVWEVVNVNTSTNPATFQLRNLSNKDAYLPTGFKRNDTYSGTAVANIYMQAVSGACGDNHFALSFTNVINASNDTYHFNSDTEAVGFFGYSETVTNTSSQISFAIYKAVAETTTPADDDDEPTVCTIDKTNGKLYKDGTTENQTWNNTWKSNNNELTFTATANNMQWATSDANHIDAHSGSSQNSTYTLTATSASKRITGVTVTMKSLSANNQTWTINGTEYTITQTPQTITIDNIERESITMVNKGSNDGTLLTDFNVTLTDYSPLNGVFSTDLEHANWVRITNSRSGNYVLTTKTGDTTGSALHSATTNMADDHQLFALVGNMANGFYIYNKALTGKTLTAANANSGTSVTWADGTSTKWYLVDTYLNASNDAGYLITTTSNGSNSMNMHGGAGNDIKFYGGSDGGSRWYPVPVSTTPTVVRFVTSGTKAHNDANPYLGVLNITKGEYSSSTYINADEAGKTYNYYFPKTNEAAQFSNTKLHGWTCNITENNGEYTVTYTAEETDYQYLAFREDAQWNRIPAIATAKNGDLVAVYDYRVCHNDVGAGEVDQMGRYSTDNGQTWSEEKTIADGSAHGESGNVFGRAYGDPAIVADRESGKVAVFCVSGQTFYPNATASQHGMVAGFYSEDNGHTWQTPFNLTSQFWGSKGSMFQDEDTEAEAIANNSQFVYTGFIGSGGLVQSRKVKVGSYYRIYAAMLCRGRNIAGAYVIYSDDFGQHWHLLGGDNSVQAAPNSDEPKVEELPNGDVILSCRKTQGRYFNIWKWSALPTTGNATGTGAWGTMVDSKSCTGGINLSCSGNSCNGEILYVEATNATTGQPAKLMLQSIPAGDNRSNVEIWYKDITDASSYATSQAFASNWTKGLQVSTTSSAYSTMTVQQDGRIGFFYEEGPATYCMVYVPLTIAKITANAYNGVETPVDPTSVEVTYNIYLGDVKIGEEKVTETIGDAPTFTLTTPNYVTVAETLPEVISSSMTSFDLHTSYTNLPFTPDDKYYNIKITVPGSGTFWWNNEDGSAKELKAAPTSGNEGKAMWVIGGDWYNGFTIQSRVDGKYVASPAIDSNNVQANLVSTLSDLARFTLEHRDAGFSFKVKGGNTFLAHTSINTLKLSMWNVATYNGNLVTFAEVGDVPAVLQEKIEEVFEHMYYEEVGYPDVNADDNQTAINALFDYLISEQVDETNYEAAVAAYDAVLALTEVVLPEAGHAYKLSLRSTDGSKHWYLKNDGSVSENEADAAIFVMGASGREDEFRAIFVTNNNDGIHYLKSNGATSATYAANYCDFQIAPMVGVSNNFITTNKATRFGSFVLKANLRHDKDASGPVNGVMILKEDNKAWDKSDAPYMNGTYTSAIEMTEVEYPYTAPTLVKNGDEPGAFASIWLPFPMIFPEGVEVYKGTQERGTDGNSYLGLERVDSDHAVAKGGYILYSESLAGEINVQPVAGTPAANHEDGDAAFYGTTEGYAWDTFLSEHTDATPYVLANKSKGIGFYRYTGTTFPKGKAIWMKPTGTDAECVKFGFDDVISAIGALHGHTEGTEIFDLQGRRLDKVQKGQVNVINGQKIMFKGCSINY